jgi:hypothetical protein
MITRDTDEVASQVTVVDRPKLGELRRRWNDKHYASKDLGVVSTGPCSQPSFT